MTLYLRPAQPTDAGRTGEILWDHAKSEAGVLDLFSCAEAIACCGEMIDRGWVTVGTLGGRVGAFLARSGAEISSLYVSRNANGRGLGKLLLKDAKAQSDALWLEVHPDNDGAQRFYRRLGFKPASEQSDTTILMRWEKEPQA